MGRTVSTYFAVEESGIYVCGTCGDNQMPLAFVNEIWPPCDTEIWPPCGLTDVLS